MRNRGTAEVHLVHAEQMPLWNFIIHIYIYIYIYIHSFPPTPLKLGEGILVFKTWTKRVVMIVRVVFTLVVINRSILSCGFLLTNG